MVKPPRGLLYMAASALAFSVMSVLVKVASPRLPLGEIVFGRALVTLVLSYALVRRAGVPSLGTQRGRLLLRGVLGFGGLSGYYIGLARLPLADATTLQNTIPLLTALLAWWWLGERVGRTTAVALACGFAGVVTIAQPGGGLDPLGVAAVLGGALCSAIAYVTIRRLARTEHPLVIVLFFPVVAVPASLPWAIATYVRPQPIDLLLLAAIGTATQLGQVFLTLGLAAERAGRASAIGYLQVAFAMGWQLLVFGTTPSLTTLLGAALIVAGTLVTASTADKAPA